MTFSNGLIKSIATIFIIVFILKNFPGDLSGTQKTIVLSLIGTGATFYFLASYMDAFALTSRRGSEATPSNNPDAVWQIIGLFFSGLGVLLWGVWLIF